MSRRPTRHGVKLPKVDFPDGTRVGGPIPGSRYVRSVCARCGEPMRVVKASLHDVCRGCGTPREANDKPVPCRRRTELDYHGSHLEVDR